MAEELSKVPQTPACPQTEVHLRPPILVTLHFPARPRSRTEQMTMHLPEQEPSETGPTPMIETLWEDQRKEAFRMLVELQDQGILTDQSRAQVAAHFSINVRDVQCVEREGITKQWAPL
jgi:hypothetical protein